MPSITVELLFESSSSAKYNHQGLLHGTRKMLAEYEQNIVYPKDREQYHKYAAPDTILQRLAACPDGLLSCCVRLKDAKGITTGPSVRPC